jgi:elongation factor P
VYSTSEFRKGLKIEHNGKPYVIIEFQHVAPGKGAAFVKARLKQFETGQVLDVTFKSGDTVPEADVETKSMQYLYKDGESFVFMDSKTYDQVSLSPKEMGEKSLYLVENSEAMITFYENRAVSVDVPNFVVLKITETQPNIKGDTSGGGGKPATLETGLTVTVPFHLNEGESIKVDTRSKEYIEKVKT